MATKYKAWERLSRLPRIDVVEVLRETKSTVTLLDGKNERKRTDWHAYFDTWEEAQHHLLQIAQGDVKGARLSLHNAHRRVANIAKMRKP